jgi:TRAP transporter TAXI family solute receptor
MNAIRDKVVRPAILAGALLAISHGAAAQQVLIGTGQSDLMQYSVGRAICHLAERADKVSCRPMETGSTIDSLVNVAGGALDFALVPADLHFQAVNGTGPFAFIDTDVTDLRSVFSLYAEALTLVVNGQAGIAALGDLRGRRVNLGAGGSRDAEFSEIILQAMGCLRRPAGTQRANTRALSSPARRAHSLRRSPEPGAGPGRDAV